jgi:phospholipid-binding lipoprotein MlaA
MIAHGMVFSDTAKQAMARGLMLMGLAVAVMIAAGSQAMAQVQSKDETKGGGQVVSQSGSVVTDRSGQPLSAPQAAAGAKEFADDDPFEGLNRGIFAVNRGLDIAVIRPLARGYQTAVPDGVRDSVRNFISNLGAPVDFLNSLLQGKVSDAGHVFGRFLTNTVLGVGGLFDPASDFGVTKVDADFGQTLGHYGVGTGPYLVLPLMGPSDLRDALGGGVDMVADPVPETLFPHQSRMSWQGARYATMGIDFRAQNMAFIDDIFENSVDPYTTFKSFYLQRRAHLVGEDKGATDAGGDAWQQFQQEEQEMKPSLQPSPRSSQPLQQPPQQPSVTNSNKAGKAVGGKP